MDKEGRSLVRYCWRRQRAPPKRSSFQFGGCRAVIVRLYYCREPRGLFAAEQLEVQLLAGRRLNGCLTIIATGAADMGEGGRTALFTAKLQKRCPSPR